MRTIPEAIVVVDIIEATETNDLFGWYATGRGLFQELRRLVTTIGKSYGLKCKKSTGDGFLLAYKNPKGAGIGVVNAVKASFELLNQLAIRNNNPDLPEEQAINVRFAIHLGEVDVVSRDREGPNVSFTFRLESIRQTAVAEAMNPMPADQFPMRNYVLCSESVKKIVERRCPNLFTFLLVGEFKLKGFSGRHEVHLVSQQPSHESSPG